jgi:hypothetical protein
MVFPKFETSVSRTIPEFRPARSYNPDSKTASGDPAATHALYPGTWRLRLASMRLSES